MLQLVYVSTARSGGTVDHEALLDQARRNNRRDGITGLLYADKRRFLQAIEGPDAAVEALFARIQADPRHHAIVLLSCRPVQAREFGDWEMAHLTDATDRDALVARIRDLVARATPAVRGTFEGFAAIRRAA